jgi:hypothetical protein
MRSVFVFPRAEQEAVRDLLSRLETPDMSVTMIPSPEDPTPLYRDWQPSDIRSLEAALGVLPSWCVVCDVSGGIAGDEEIRRVVLELLADGGVAVDDYSEHCWTAEEIAGDATVDGLKFFDYLEHYRRYKSQS